VYTLERVQHIVTNLALPKDNYVLFGSLPMLAHGLVTDVNDIDILATNTAWTYAQTLGPVMVSPKGFDLIQLEHVEIFNEWMGLNIESIFARAVMLHGLPFASLEDVLEYKQILNRPKDKHHIHLIREFLNQSHQ
jgi:hypothetical protein